MVQLNIERVIKEMKVHAEIANQLYFTEADIQFAMAWAIRNIYGYNALIEMEVPFYDESNKKIGRVDMVVTLNKEKEAEETSVSAIEFKYRRRGMFYDGRELPKDNPYRSDLLLDLQRLEKLVDDKALTMKKMLKELPDMPYGFQTIKICGRNLIILELKVIKKEMKKKMKD